METNKDHLGDDRDDCMSKDETQSEKEGPGLEVTVRSTNVKHGISSGLSKSEKEATTSCRTPMLSPQNRLRTADALPSTSVPDSISGASSESWLNTSLEEQVLFAGTIVAQALYDGPWPSPGINETTNSVENGGTDQLIRHRAHMSMIGASLRKFCQDIILRTMSDLINNESIHKTEASLDERPLLGTLLMIREVLAQNYFTIFGSNGILRDDKNKVIDSGLATFSSRVVATSVILYAIQQQPRTEKLANVFLDKANEYDESRGSFNGLLSSYIDKKERPELTSMRDDSFALHACKHPLFVNQTIHSPKKRRQSTESDNLRLPEPNAVHITILRPTNSEYSSDSR